MHLSYWLFVAEWRTHRVQAMVAVIAIALGVALGFSIHLINAAAFNEFSAAVRSLTGQSDLQVQGKQAMFDESLYPTLATYTEVELANPILELDAFLLTESQGRKDNRLKVLGIDMLRAARISPDLIGMPAEDRPLDGLADDAIFLSPAAMEWLQVRQGEMLAIRVGTQIVTLRIAGGLVRARAGQRIAVMDIGAVQWHFRHIGLLSRVELKLRPGVNRDAFKAALAEELGERYFVTEIADQEMRIANMSRAYRVNLNMLALVALFTGAFLVFSTQVLSITRRRHQFALLRVLGLTRSQLLRQILLEGATLGVIGSLLGLMLGYTVAIIALHFFGGDLGGGFFPGIKPSVHFNPLATSLFFIIGLSITLLGSVVPAWEAAHAKPATALKSGSEDMAVLRWTTPWPAIICLCSAILLTQLPPVFELPVFGYLAIALVLIGGIALMPVFSAFVFSFLLKRMKWPITGAVLTLALARLANTPNQASIALGGVLASFSLMVAMAIMVTSFRISIDDWLLDVLPADLYVQAASSGDQGGFQLDEQKIIATVPGITRIDFLRVLRLVIDPERPAITLIARPIDLNHVGNTLPIIDEMPMSALLREDVKPIWVSEAMVDLYGYTIGKRITLPIGTTTSEFLIAGIWRDYGRQFGAVQMRLVDYQTLSADYSINTAALWLQAGMGSEQVSTALQRLPFGDTLEISASSEMRALSLEIFDRSFAVTYLLEIVAVIIGLLGVAASFSAQALARAKEFGMLRHIGVTRRQILALLITEGGLLTALGIMLGFVIGWGISLILVFVVNPQSFHWTMQLHLPWIWLTIVAGVMLLSAALTALIAGRRAVSVNVVRAVREDW